MDCLAHRFTLLRQPLCCATQMLAEQNLLSLQERRKDLRVVFLFKDGLKSKLKYAILMCFQIVDLH